MTSLEATETVDSSFTTTTGAEHSRRNDPRRIKQTDVVGGQERMFVDARILLPARGRTDDWRRRPLFYIRVSSVRALAHQARSCDTHDDG